MSVDRIWRWRCDAPGCGAVAEVDDYGLPRGWIFVKGRPVSHRCPACKDSIPRERRGIPEVVADR